MEHTKVKLGEVTKVFNNKRIPLSSNQRKNKKGDFPYYGAQGVIDNIDEYIFDGKYILIAEDGANLETRKQPIARMTKQNEKFWVNNHAHIITSNEKSVDEYLYYYINSIDIKTHVTGSAQPKLTKENLLNIELNLPPLEEQKRIADILTALDDKIELNNQMNQTLEEIASLLYKRWFVDFEFPDDKGNPYKSSGGEMVDSELGMIPKGWEVKELGEFITLINGYAFKSGSYSKDGNYKIITIKNVLDNKFITNSTNKILEIPDNVIENQKLKIGDVLISLTGNVGRVCVVTEGECLLNQRVAKIISKIEVNKYYWRTFFNTEEIKIKMINISKGTAQSNLSTIEIMKIKILNSKEVTYNFSEKIKAISKKKLQNEIMILNIEMIKQKLLEELV